MVHADRNARLPLMIRRGRSVAARSGVVSLIASLLSSSVGHPVNAQSSQPPLPDAAAPLAVTTRTIDRFQLSDPRRKRFGKLEFRGGLVMSGKHGAFGGWSGITMDADGKRFLAVSDEGAWMSGEITYKGAAPTGITGATIGPIRALRGRQIDKKRDLDAEAVTTLDGNLTRGTLLVGFERNHRIGVFPVANGEIGAPTRYLKLPQQARRMSSNKGFEAVAVLKGGPHKGSVIALSERFPGTKSHHAGWIWINGEPKSWGLADIAGFDLTDAVSTGAGDLLVLERRFRWSEGIKMRVRRFPASAIRPGAKLDGEILFEADMAYDIDNMEGLGLHTAPNGDTVLTLVSDNNFNSFLQRNLLLQFTLLDTREASRGKD